jgi:hypothetical protein
VSSLEVRLGLGGRSAWREPPVPTQAEATAFIAAMAVQPTDDRKSAINRFVYRLKSSSAYTGQPTSLWAKLDALYLLGAHHEQASRLNLVAPSTYTADPTGHAPTFTTDRGWQGNGVDQYLDTGFNASSAAGRKFGLNNASLFLWSLTDLQADQPDIGGGNNTRIISRGLSGNLAVRPNTTTSVGGGAAASSLGLFGWSRTASDAVSMFQGGNVTATATTASTAVSNAAIRICASGSAFSTRKIAIAGAGAALSAAEIAWLDFACEQYLRHCGAVA